MYNRVVEIFTAKAFLISFLIFGAMAFYIFLSYAQIIEAKDEYQRISRRLEKRTTAFKRAVSFGDIEGSIESVSKLNDDIKEAKILAQSLGQDLKYLQLTGMRSNYVDKERLLNLAYETINFSKNIGDKAANLYRPEFFTGEGYLLDIQAIRDEFLNLLPQTSRKIDKISREIKFTSLGEASFIFEQLDQFKSTVNDLEKLLNDDLGWLLNGDQGKRKFLIIFQNNSELRGGSGGSLGSFGVATIDSGKLSKIDFGTNIYKIDKAFLEKEKIPAPSELEAFNDGFWSMKHAGFAVDGPESLDKIEWFYNKETGENVDGAITIDTTSFGFFLESIGQIEMPEYKMVLNKDNFKQELEREVQIEYFKRDGGKGENEPKKIISLIMPKFIDRLFETMRTKEGMFKIVAAINKSVAQKNILFHIDQADFQGRIDKFNASGKVADFDGDYLMINNSNLAGAKSSQNINEKIVLNVEITDQGTISNELLVSRKHTGKDEWPDGLDRNYIRLLLPKESTIQNFQAITGNFQRYYDRGFKNGQPYWIEKEAEKSSVNFWMSTQPGEISEARLGYHPNYKVRVDRDFTYNLLIQKQPGAPADEVILNVKYPKGFRPINLQNYDPERRLIILKFPLNKDEAISLDFALNAG